MRLVFATILVCAISPVALRGGDAGGDRLLRDLQTAADDERRIEIVAALGAVGSDPVRLALEAIALNGGEPSMLRMQAICALAGSATRDTVPVLMTILERDLQERQGYWACAIPLLGALADRRAVDLLKQISELQEAHLAGMDHMAIEAVAAMADIDDAGFLERKAHIGAVRPAVFEALARIAEPSTAATLATGLLSGEDERTVAAAETGLLAIGSPARDVLTDMLETLEDDVMQRRAKALLEQME